MDFRRTFITLVVTVGLLVLLAVPAYAQVKAQGIHNERQLKKVLATGQSVDGGSFELQLDVKKRYVAVLDRKTATKGRQDVSNFFKRLKILSPKVVWDYLTEMNEENSSSQPMDLLSKLPHETKRYRIKYDYKDDVLLIIPLVEINTGARSGNTPTGELQRVWPVYEKYCLEAIDWLKRQGFQGDFTVEFWMQEFWPKGNSIKTPWK